MKSMEPAVLFAMSHGWSYHIAKRYPPRENYWIYEYDNKIQINICEGWKRDSICPVNVPIARKDYIFSYNDLIADEDFMRIIFGKRYRLHSMQLSIRWGVKAKIEYVNKYGRQRDR